MSGLVNDSLFHIILDSAADVSLVPESLVDELKLTKTPLDKPFEVEGFQSSSDSSVQIQHKCNITTNFFPGKLHVEFFVAPIDGNYAILGTDVLGDPEARVGFETSTAIFRLGEENYQAKKTWKGSTVEFRRREKMGVKNYIRQNAAVSTTPEMRCARRTVIRPRAITYIDAQVHGKNVPSHCHSFLSKYDYDMDLITIPSFTFQKRHKLYRLPVINETNQTIIFDAKKYLGDVVQHYVENEDDDEAEEEKASVFHIISGSTLERLSLEEEEEEEEDEEEVKEEEESKI